MFDLGIVSDDLHSVDLISVNYETSNFGMKKFKKTNEEEKHLLVQSTNNIKQVFLCK